MMDLFKDVPFADIAGIIACLMASAFFSGSETALTSIASTRARHLVDSDPGRYGILTFWLEHRKRIVTTLLVGNNIVNIVCSILAYRVALQYFQSYAEAISAFGLTLVILVFGEVTPKTIALVHGEKVAVPLLRIVWIVDKLFWVITAPITRIPEFFLGRTHTEVDDPTVTEDEIEFQIRLGHDREVFEETEQGELLMSAVEFQDIAVKDVMIPRTDIFGLEVTESLEDSLVTIIAKGHSRIPIFHDNLDEIIGLLYVKDLLKLLNDGCEGGVRPSLESMVRNPPLFVPETRKISNLLAEMRRKHLHMAIVVDEFGGTSGLITLEDIIEELVGDIRDEYDTEDIMVRKVEEHTWRVDARLRLIDLFEQTGIELPDTGDYESVGGFVVAQHGSIPREGSVITSHGLRITVLLADDRRVRKLEISTFDEQTPS